MGGGTVAGGKEDEKWGFREEKEKSGSDKLSGDVPAVTGECKTKKKG